MERHLKIIDLPKIFDNRGNLSFFEGFSDKNFQIKRVHWIYDVPGGEIRGGHAYKFNEEIIICLSGSFDVFTDNGKESFVYSLNRSYKALYLPNFIWRQMKNFSTNSVALVISSSSFCIDDYILDYDEFLSYNKQSNFSFRYEKEINNKIEFLKNFEETSVYDCHLIELNKNHRIKGNITVVENYREIPFATERIYYLYDIPGGESRGGHAHKELFQLIVAVSGSFDVILDDGIVKRSFTLNRPFYGLLIVPGIWRELVNFSSGAICLVLASSKYEINDYIREYEEFKKFKSL